MNSYKNARWRNIKKKWRQRNPASGGYYICALCYVPVKENEMSLDHIKESRYYPKLAYKLDNLQPTHVECNLARARNMLKLSQEDTSSQAIAQ